jgi:hypothetical protein
MSIKVMKQALGALYSINSPLYMIEIERVGGAMAALRQAIKQAEDAVAAEREACAVLCETECAQNDGITCAEEIRRRGEK